MKKLLLASLLLLPSLAHAETWPQLKDRLTKAMGSHDPRQVQFVVDYALTMPLYSTATLLEAATETDGKLAYALDTDAFYFRANGAWAQKLDDSGVLTLANGGTLSNATNSSWILGENSEDISLAFTSNNVAFNSSTGATFTLTPAVGITGILTLSDALTLSDGAIFDQSANNVWGATENGEDITFTYGSNLVTIASTTGSLFTFTPATTFTGDMTLNGKSGALTVNGPIAKGPWFEASFTEGAAKGVSLYTPLGAAYATTADAVNILAYGQEHRFAFVTNTTATGTITPAGTALGLDLNAGAPGNSDEWTFTAGMAPANVGGMIIPGTTPAWEACATLDATTVTEAAGLFLEVTTPSAHVDLSGADPNYTSYAAIGIEQTDIVVSDNTDGAVDTTVDAVNATPVTLCIRGSSSSVITYYINGSNTAAAATHTLADGVPHVVRIQGLNHTGTEAPMQVSAFSLLPQ